MMLAAQEQALRANSIKFKMDKTSATLFCRFCEINTETIRHITSVSYKLAQKEHRIGHE